MKPSAAGRRLVKSPGGPFLPRDWLALLVICLLAVVIRASVMRFLPSILHPDERMWLDEANRLVNHQGLVTWDFQVGERSWLWPGLMAAFMYFGELFGSPPNASLGGVSALICIISLAPVICGFLWGRNVAGFAGAVTTGVLNAVWFELVYFYTHPLSESFAGAALVAGFFLVYPGRNVWSDRQMFIGAVMMGLAAVLRPQLIPAIALIVVAVGGIRLRAHYPALIGGLALPIVLSGLLDWITWGWPFHSTIMYVYYSAKVSSAAGLNPFYSYFGWEGVAWGFFGVVIVLCALYWGVAAAAAVLGGRRHLRRPFRFQPQGIPVYFAGPAAHHDAGRRRLDDGGRLAGQPAWPALGPARAPRRPAARLDRRLARFGRLAQPHMVLGSVSRIDPGDARGRRGQERLRRRSLPRRHVVAFVGLCRFAPRHPALQRRRHRQSDRARRL